ncbi:hypothetical protein BDR26DRAFT_865901 [Obelidium mucronatum]|nr:hypothetical protein BDR26DRAFT_865901 [Obelidium mucronatum]
MRQATGSSDTIDRNNHYLYNSHHPASIQQQQQQQAYQQQQQQQQQLSEWRAIYPHMPSTVNELALTVGDYIVVTHQYPDGWGYGYNQYTHAQGAFPLNCLGKDIPTASVVGVPVALTGSVSAGTPRPPTPKSVQSQSRPITPKEPAPASMMTSFPPTSNSRTPSPPTNEPPPVPSKDTFIPGRQYNVHANFMPELSDEIPLYVGDKVDLFEVYDDNWAYGFNIRLNQSGIFPLECIGKARSGNSKYKARDSSFRISLDKSMRRDSSGPILLTERASLYTNNTISMNGAGGIVVQNKFSNATDNASSLVKPPAAAATGLASPQLDSKLMRHSSISYGSMARSIVSEKPQYDETQVVRAVYQFAPQLSDEIEVLVGDRVVVLKKFDDGWCVGYNLTSEMEGHFPLYCVELMF